MKDQTSLLRYLYSNATSKYLKFRQRVDKAVQSGRFQRFSKKKRASLLSRIRRLRERINALSLQLKLAGTGLAFSLACAITNTAEAQTTLGPFAEKPRSESPLQWPFLFNETPRPTTVDWDGDGDKDLVVGHYGSLRYFRNEPIDGKAAFNELTGADNPFDNLIFYGHDISPNFLDFDDDGDLDLVLGSNYTYLDALQYFRNEAGVLIKDDVWTPWDNATKTGNPFYNIAIDDNIASNAKPLFMDWDDDGDYDILIGSDLEAGSLVYHINNLNDADPLEQKFIPGNLGDIGLPDELRTMSYGQAMQYGDIDGDGDSDYITGFVGGGILFIANTENGFEIQEGPWNSTTLEGNPFDQFGYANTVPHLVDFDNDGDLDVIVGRYGGNYAATGEFLLYLENKGNGIFEQKEDLENPFNGVRASTTFSNRTLYPEFVDTDNDGDLDALIGDKYDSGLRYYRNDNGKFVKAESPLLIANEMARSSASAVDIDADGDLDIFVGQVGDDYLSIPTTLFFLNNGDGSYTESPDLNPLAELPLSDGVRLTFANADDDEDLDLWVTWSSGKVFYRNTGSKTEPAFTQDDTNDPLAAASGFQMDLESVDIDGDGDLDVLQTEYYSYGAEVRLFVKNTDGSFTESVAVDNPFDFIEYTNAFSSISDHDSDGDHDLFLVVQAGEIRYFENENPAPILGTSAPLELVMSSEPKIISADFGLTDSDNDKYVEVVVSVIGYEQGLDVLDYDGTFGEAFTEIHFDEVKGALHFTPNTLADGEDLEAMLASITYQYTGGDIGNARKRGGSTKRTITKTIRFEVFDRDRTIPIPLDFTITHPNEVPTLSSTAPDIIYTPATGAVVIDNTVLVSDNDDNDIHSATIRIIGYQSGEDELLFTNANGIAASPFNTSTGVLTLNGVASLADYQIALRSVQYRNNASILDATPRSFEFTVYDGESLSMPVMVNLQVNNPPQINLSQATASYETSAIAIDNAAAVLDDGSIQQAVILISNGLDVTEDALLYTDVVPLTSSYTAATGILMLTGPATAAQFQTALRSIQYSNSDPDGGETPRVITIQLTDDVGNNSATATMTINFTVQSPPVVTSSITDVDYASGTLVVNSDITLSDSDNTDLASATVSITSGFANGEDVLSVTPAGGISGTYDATTGILTITGTASLASYQSVLRSVRYENTNSSDRNKTSRTIAFRVNDGTDNSNTFGTTLNLPNQAPGVIANATTPAYESGALIIAGEFALSDFDNATMQSATIAITSGLVASEDVLSFTTGNDISGTYNTNTGILSLTGTASLASYEAAIRSVTYENTNLGDRDKNPRTISFRVNDGIDNSNTSSTTLTLPNATPVVGVNGNPPLYGSMALVIAGQLTLDDSDNATLQSATIAITSGLASGQDVLVFANQNGITGTYTASDGTLVLTGTASEGNYQAALRTVAYDNTTDSPSETPRVVSISINDGLNSSTAATVTIDINRAPVITPQSSVTGAGGQVSIDLNNIVSDPDNNLDLNNISLINIVTPPSSGAEATIVGGTLILNYANVPDFTGTDQLTLEICDNLNRCAVQILSIEVGSGIEVFNAVSQNGDEVNDFLFLRHIKPNNRVTIYNRWGDKVFEMDNYDNTTPGKRFEGFNNNGNALATGTYFYKVEYGNEVIATGYLSLKQ